MGEEFSKLRFEDWEDAQERKRANAAMMGSLGMGAGGKVGGTLERALLRHQDIASFTVLRSADDDFWDGRINLQPNVTHRRLAAEDPQQ